MENKYRCQVKGISKNFPGVKALNDVSIDILPGEIHAIVGENGAGKSTLMNILSGVFMPDAGSVVFHGKEESITDPRYARALGISMIHQELALFNHMCIYENIFVGRMPKRKFGFVDIESMVEGSRQSLEKLGVLHINVKDLVSSLSISEMQLVEIAKAISINAELLIMDEPTSSLTTAEITRIIEVMKLLKEQDVSILFITHKLEEVMEVADRITVLRDGVKIKTVDKNEITIPEMVSLMVGREFEKGKHRDFIKDYTDKEVILEVENLCVPGRVENASFKLYKGEVLGLTGLVGAGRSELLQGIFGVYPGSTGKIKFEGKEVIINHPNDAVALGIGLVPEGRKEQGMFLKLDVKDNMTIVHRRTASNRIGVIDDKSLLVKARDYVKSLSIKTPSLGQISNLLSGGNQQKTIIARWLMTKPKIVFMDEPTHGIDVGAKAEIYEIIDQLSKQGVSVIFLSSELPEVLAMGDRIMVMHKGKIVETLGHDEADEVSIMQHAFNQSADVS